MKIAKLEIENSAMRFQLPQFIETEINIIGPLTLKQFLWVAAGTVIVFLLYTTIKGMLFFIIALPLAAVFIALAFAKVEGEPLIDYVVYGLSYILNPKKYYFKKEETTGLSDIGPEIEKNK